ncbi:MAG: sugar ABC transporter ATP-binding protein, partial [Actinobacteria bacterium]|nr:sugar ABC transporter ATP-binding protein [Actinomycetota bacterium]
MNNEFILEMKNISKSFPGVQALDDVSLKLKKGEILGLLGENGAGKSTLIKILSGVYSLEKGKILIDGEPVIFNDPSYSLSMGIRVIYQELTGFEPLTVAENIFAGEVISNKLGFVRWNKMIDESKDILKRLESDIKPLELMENLTVAEKQIVEIGKAIRKKAKILIMDEPTSALNEKEVLILYKIMRKLKSEGVSIIYISHRIEEIFQITDRVVILRDGRKVGDIITKDTDIKTLISMIVGRELVEQYPKQNIEKGKVILEVKNLTYMNKIKNISFMLKEGEIVAFFGLLGSGIQQLFPVLFGIKKKTSGEVYVEGKRVEIYHTNTSKKNKIGYVPVDRKEEGLALSLDIKENITSANIENMGKGFIFDKTTETNHSKNWFNKLNIKAPSMNMVVNNLSGGNQQKVVVSKWLERGSKILIMNEPTRGIDVGSKAEIYGITENLCKNGVGVLMVSSELPEIIAISDRVII